MRLHVVEWGDPRDPPVVCVHGIGGHSGRWSQLAEERWSRSFHVIAVDLRGHARSEWTPPWDFGTHVADLVETVDALGLDQPSWVGHSFGGRLVVELAARHPDRIRRAVLVDPALQVREDVAGEALRIEAREPVFASVEASVADDGDIDVARAVRDVAGQMERLPDGFVRRLTSQECVLDVWGALTSAPPLPDVLTMPTLVIFAPAGEITLVHQAHAYGRDGVVEVEGGHMLMWSAFDETADAVERFLSG